MEAKIIAYRSYRDIDIRFTDGTVREHVFYDQFKNGKIGNPNMPGTKAYIDAHSKNRVGEKRMMSCGMVAEIIEYRRSDDIDIRFEDGTIRRHRNYRDFLNGGILPFADRARTRVGEKKTMLDKSVATVTAYRRFSDIDVLFDSGEKLTGVSYRHFADGTMKDPAKTRIKRSHIGETVRQACGLEATIFGHHGGGKVDVRFSDGVIRKRVQYGEFRRGDVGHEARKKNRDGNQTLTDRIGEKKMMACGLEAEIVAYRRSTDIDVLFSDGSFLEHQYYEKFKHGLLHPPKNKRLPTVGETIEANNGQKMTISHVESAKDLDVCFENGTTVRHRSYYSFLHRSISNPNGPDGHEKWRIGMTGTANNGLRIKIIGRKNKDTVIIQFESGQKREILTNNFRLGRANVYDENGKTLLSRSPNVKGIFLGYITQYAYADESGVWYKTVDEDTGERGLLTPQMMMKNRGIKPVF